MSSWRLPENHGRFRAQKPFPHFVFDEFLDARLFARLQEQFPAFDAGQARNELGVAGGKAVFPRVRELGDAYREFDEVMRSAAFLRALGAATGIPKLLYDPEYVGGGAHLNRSGQDLDLHVDFNFHPRTQTHRRLNLILFLNPAWDPAWGGCLELREDPWKPAGSLVEVTPAPNRCVIFETSERSWHGFRRIQLPPEWEAVGRRTLAVYFYTASRPEGEVAPSHGTFYVPRPLPERFEPGYPLRPEDLHELKVLLQRRDSQIEHLYQRELEYSRILHSPSARLARWMTTPFRWLKGFGSRASL